MAPPSKQIGRRHALAAWALSLALLWPFNLGQAQTSPPEFEEAFRTLLLTMDKGARFRDDALVTLSDGTQYVLVSPLEKKPPAEGLKVIKRMPEQAPVADILVLNDGHFLLRIMTLPNGRKTFPILNDLPLELRSALLPQNFSFPEAFLLPTVWKSLTGNLLVLPPGEAEQPHHYPLAILSDTSNTLTLWDLARGETQSQLDLKCQPATMALSADAQRVYLGCKNEAKLYDYILETGTVKEISLPSPPGAMVSDDPGTRLYVSHPKIPRISVIQTQTGTVEREILLPEPVDQLALSPFRKKLFAVSVPAEDEPVATRQSEKKGLFKRLAMPKKPAAPAASVTTNTRIQVIDLTSLQVELSLSPDMAVSRLYIQDEKRLWMLGQGEPTLRFFDMRWQDFSDKIPLPALPIALESDETWLYVLQPHGNTLGRLNTKTLTWGKPIALEPGAKPASMALNTFEHQIYVLSANPPGVQVVSLDKGEWVGTQQTPFQGSGPMAWVIPNAARPDQRVKIKFQDGRLLLQNAQGRPWETLRSDPRDPQKSQTQPAPGETP